MLCKLSICIPTFNMDVYLSELLRSIEREVASGLQVVICDNKSVDSTRKIVDEFIGRNPSLDVVYVCNEENIGPDRNFLKAIELATGEYCWLIGADDVVKSGAIDRVLNELVYSEKDVYLADRDEYDINMNFKTSRKWLNCKGDKDFEFNNDRDYFEYFQECNSLGSLFSFISSIIVRREAWDRAYYDNSFYDSFYSHVYKVFSMLSSPKSLGMKYLNGPIIDCRTGNDSFSHDGVFRRYEIDIDGYARLGNALFDSVPIRSAFWQVIVNYTPWYRLAKVRYASQSRGEWEALVVKLRVMGFSSFLLLVVGWFGAFRPIMKLLIMSWHIAVFLGLRR